MKGKRWLGREGRKDEKKGEGREEKGKKITVKER